MLEDEAEQTILEFLKDESFLKSLDLSYELAIEATMPSPIAIALKHTDGMSLYSHKPISNVNIQHTLYFSKPLTRLTQPSSPMISSQPLSPFLQQKYSKSPFPPVSAISINITCSLLAVSHSHRHRDWCHHEDGCVQVYSLLNLPHSGFVVKDIGKLEHTPRSSSNFSPSSLVPTAPLYNIITHTCITTVAFHPSLPHTLAIGDVLGNVMLYSLGGSVGVRQICRSSGSPVSHVDSVTSLMWLESKRLKGGFGLVSSGRDGKILLWDIRNGFKMPIGGCHLARGSGIEGTRSCMCVYACEPVVGKGSSIVHSQYSSFTSSDSIFPIIISTENGAVLRMNLLISERGIDDDSMLSRTAWRVCSHIGNTSLHTMPGLIGGEKGGDYECVCSVGADCCLQVTNINDEKQPVSLLSTRLPSSMLSATISHSFPGVLMCGSANGMYLIPVKRYLPSSSVMSESFEMISFKEKLKFIPFPELGACVEVKCNGNTFVYCGTQGFTVGRIDLL
ncbi:hypothetical protein ADUPG1_000154 [Aduncisulcus paluster]|uniref:Uncharacterized protein n=1 Tax=Aduncisulcus paluster TaxID=2918883 RepID=A0ABQ5K5B8_9EUKA|nr:hypothetical protein ADUPG1_000154 [Aduncisulcus paluster]